MKQLLAILLLLLPMRMWGQGVVFSCYDAADGLSDNQVQHIMQLHDGRMVFTTLGNINIWDGTRFSYIHHQQEECHGLGMYHGNYHVYADSLLRLWVKDYGRLWCFDLKQERYIAPPDAIGDVFVDSRGGVWTVGLDSMLNGRIRLEDELQDLEVLGDSLFLFYPNGAVVCHEASTGQRIYSSAAYGEDEARLYQNTSLVKLGDDGCFYQLRCGHGIFAGQCLRFNPKTREWKCLFKASTLLHTFVITAHDEVTITCPDGIWHITRSGNRLQTAIQVAGGTMVSSDFNSIFIDARGGMWLGSATHGLFYSHASRHRFSKMAAEAPHPADARRGSQDRRLTDSGGHVWEGTVDGVTIDGRTYYAEDGLSNNYVHSIAEDGHGRIWIGTSHGITRAVLDDAGHPSFVAYKEEDGTLRVEYADDDAWLLPTGHILMYGIEGEATLFHPDSVDMVALPLDPLLIGVALHGQELAIGDILHQSPTCTRHLELGHSQNTLQLRFAALNYDHPSRTVYRYRTNADSLWTAMKAAADGTLELSFVDLAPGHYALQVEATADGRWDGKTCTLTWHITPPWWRTVWAYMLYTVCVAAMGGLAVWLRLRRMQQLQREEMLLLRIRELTLKVQTADLRASTPAVAEAANEEEAEELPQDPFIARATQLVENNLDTPGYNVEQLASDLCMERSTLYKRLSALLDQTPSLFIRSIRIHAAARLLEQGELPVAEVAERTGFCSTSHLSKYFQEEYGCRPSEYMQRGC